MTESRRNRRELMAYQALLTQNFLSSLAGDCQIDGGDATDAEHSKIGLFSEKVTCQAKFAVRSAERSSRQVCKLIAKTNTGAPNLEYHPHLWSVENAESYPPKSVATDLDEISAGDQTEPLEACVPGSASAPLNEQKCYFKLCHVKNRMYYLVSRDAERRVAAFSYIGPGQRRTHTSCSQSEEVGRATQEGNTLRPINFKRFQEMSFKDLLCENCESISSDENSPTFIHKQCDQEEKYAGISATPLISKSQGKLRYNLTDQAENLALLLRHSNASSSSTTSTDYDPNLISSFDPDCRERKTVMKFPGYTCSVLHYLPEHEAKRLINEVFRTRYPQIHVSFSKINSIKRELHSIAKTCDLDKCTVAHAYVFYEKVLLQGSVCKTNRKLVAGACLLVAAKITDLGKLRLTDIVNCLEASLRVNRKELLRYEIPLCAALSFNLKVPEWQLYPHYQRIALSSL